MKGDFFPHKTCTDASNMMWMKCVCEFANSFSPSFSPSGSELTLLKRIKKGKKGAVDPILSSY